MALTTIHLTQSELITISNCLKENLATKKPGDIEGMLIATLGIFLDDHRNGSMTEEEKIKDSEESAKRTITRMEMIAGRLESIIGMEPNPTIH